MAAVRTGGPGAKGVSALIIPLKAKGVVRKQMHNSGVSASGKVSQSTQVPEYIIDCLGSTYIEFDDVAVPAQNLIGRENEGFAIIMSSM